jgi:hypothetical protein
VAAPAVTPAAGAPIAAATVASAKTCVTGTHAAISSRADGPAIATSAVAPARDDYDRDQYEETCEGTVVHAANITHRRQRRDGLSTPQVVPFQIRAGPFSPKIGKRGQYRGVGTGPFP